LRKPALKSGQFSEQAGNAGRTPQQILPYVIDMKICNTREEVGNINPDQNFCTDVYSCVVEGILAPYTSEDMSRQIEGP
jgi:hypothetical protein